MEISNIFYILKKCSSTANIFMFNLPRATVLERDNYKILENIKDGSAVAGKYQSCKVRLKKPNIVIVFSNYGPETDALSEDRWNIFKISKDLSSLVTLTCGQAFKYRQQRMQDGTMKKQVYYTYFDPDSQWCERYSTEWEIMGGGKYNVHINYFFAWGGKIDIDNCK